MVRATLATLRRRPSRLLMSVIAIALGVAFVTGTLIFTSMLSGSLDRIRLGTVPDVLVARESSMSGTPADASETPAVLTPTDLAAITDVAGVRAVHGMVTEPGVQVLDRNDRVSKDYLSPSGLNWFAGEAAYGGPAAQLMAGSAPGAPGEVVLDTQTLAASKLSVGDPVVVVLPRGGEVTATIVGVARYGSGDATAPRAVWFTSAEAQRLFLDGDDAYTGAWIELDPEAIPTAVRGSVAAILPDRIDAWTAERAAALGASRMERALAFVDAFVLVFAAIAVVAAAFLIVNTFAVVVAGRARELAVLRLLGASRAQVSGAVLFEGLVTGVAGCLLGVPAGIGLAMASAELVPDLDFPAAGTLPLLERAILPGVALGLVITLLAAVRPARLAARADPLNVLAGRVTTGEERLGRIIVPSVLLALVGGAALLAATLRDVRFEILVVGGGALALLVGVTAASPVLGRPILTILGVVWRLTFGMVGRLAHLNLKRQPGRTATMAAALTIGMSLVGTVAVLSSSTTASLDSQVRASIPADFRIYHARLSPLDAAVTDRISGIEGVAKVHELQRGVVSWADESRGLMAQTPAAFGRVFDQTLTDGSVPTRQNEVIMADGLAKRHGVRTGSEIEVTMRPRGEPVTLTITGLFAQSDASLAPLITVPETLSAIGLPSHVTMLGIDLRTGADLRAVRAGLDQALADSPVVKVLDRQLIVEQQLSLIAKLLGLVKAILLLSVFVAALGIVNTLSLSVSERIREIGLLRAVGLTRPQLGWMIRMEAVSVAVLGCAVGAGLGLLVGAALQQALAPQGLTVLEIPGQQFAAAMIASVVLGVLAASWPAHLAARINVVRAISLE